jgi:flagellar basal body-associated protein FliL
MSKNQEAKTSKLKQIMAITAIVLIVVFIIAACVCVAFGNMQLMLASLFCLVAVPIMIYFFIWIYDSAHRYDKTEEAENEIGSEGNNVK